MLVTLKDGTRLKPRGMHKGLNGIKVCDQVIVSVGEDILSCQTTIGRGRHSLLAFIAKA
jgi:hypothetical protein